MLELRCVSTFGAHGLTSCEGRKRRSPTGGAYGRHQTENEIGERDKSGRGARTFLLTAKGMPLDSRTRPVSMPVMDPSLSFTTTGEVAAIATMDIAAVMTARIMPSAVAQVWISGVCSSSVFVSNLNLQLSAAAHAVRSIDIIVDRMAERLRR